MKNVNELQNYTFKENAFKFVQTDAKISDTKLDTKPRSALQDAFKRFCKNKSSVVAAVILGILILLALLVPWCSPYDVDSVHLSEVFLQPKLFETGTGFWDGTKRYDKTVKSDGTVSAIVYDRVNKTPAGFKIDAVLDLKVDEEPTLINSVNAYGTGGFVVFENQSRDASNTNILSSGKFILTADGNYKAAVVLGNEQALSESTLGEYRVLITGGAQNIVLKDWSKDYSSYTLDLSNAVEEAGLTEITDAQLVFELKAIENRNSYLLLKSCDITTDNADAYVTSSDGTRADFSELGFVDATKMVSKAPDSHSVFPAGYWTCSGRKGIYASEIYYCTFTYDTYEAVYGKTEVVYNAVDFNKMVEDGLCEYDASVGISSFKRLSDECPIVEVLEQKVNSRTGKLQELKTVSYNYLALGYKSMPKFILGTDASGIDLFTRVFAGMRTSLLLGVCVAAFCFLFGLVWGAISGYFGGAVDLMMERFCDILGGVPWIVIMTLCILHLGNNFATFVLALCMTGWMGTAARTRTQFYRFKGQEYVLASRTLGAKDFRLIFKHILPNSMGTIVTSSVLMVPSTIFSEATLSYLNLGLQGKQAFGVLLSNNQQYIQSFPYLIVFPSVIMALLMISFNLFGNGLRDALNPSLRGAEG
ncbi:MAG: ABC transporter permease [Corallococcus sp.]|nr:ABC transporter permease [Corallococcus sp.]MCM1359553.1 ABC transporter permease [Corallococcus sp.]MCM1395145.1 ABC transporter permease [Corallococcus sp.]